MSKNNIISIKNVWKAFGEKEILRGLSLDIPEGKIVTMLGYSGTGKSVLLRHILGLMQADKGEVIVKGQNVQNIDEDDLQKLRQSFGMLFQEVALFDSLNVFDNVAFPIREHEPEITFDELERRVENLLKLVELERDVFFKMPHNLSGGMKKRVGLARAISLEPQILLCDEPTTGLDPVTTDKIHTLIVRSVKEIGGTAFLISHDVHAALRISDLVAFLWQGKIIEAAAPKEFVSSRHEVVQQFLEAAGVRS
jgi:phospholipid/cholesterol/gamma-HCH transport system ATP-binding protein